VNGNIISTNLEKKEIGPQVSITDLI